MITIHDLKNDDKWRAEQEKLEQIQAEKRREEWEREKLLKDIARANSPSLEQELSKLLKEANALNRKELRLDEYSVWWYETRGNPHWRDYYETKFKLGFNPKTNYKPTEDVIKELNAAGFKAEQNVRLVDETTFVNDADGGGFESTGRQVPANSIIVKW